MDDVDWTMIPEESLNHTRVSILKALRAHGDLKAALFVVGRNVDNAIGREIVQSWNDAGHLIANHTYSHTLYTRCSYDQFTNDLLRNEKLVSSYSHFAKLFRFPALKEGETADKRDCMRSFLAEHGYRNGHVTIDASDWYYDRRLRERLAREPGFEVTRYRQPYLDHMWDRSLAYEAAARKLLGRSPSHTVLVHYNLLNALFLADLLDLYRNKGWQLVDAEEAYRDPLFSRAPKTLPAGESLIWALTREAGASDPLLRYPAEDESYEKSKLDRLRL
jgi:peptidoglycan/xylan/chitin deacetylase (PgdA/CDA1 family)